MEEIKFIFPFRQIVRDKFAAKDSTLIPEWAKKYDFIFDDFDIETARNQAPIRENGWGGYHFYEWLAAILIFESTGMYSLVESYQSKKHLRKQQVLKQLLNSEQLELVLNLDSTYQAQAPDLLVYAPDYSSFFFCEVKGPGDTVKPKAEEFCVAIEAMSGKPVALASFIRCDPFLTATANKFQ